MRNENMMDFFSDEFNLYTLLSIGFYLLLVGFSKSPKVLNTIPGFCAGIGVFFTFWVLYLNLKDFQLQPGNEDFLVALVQRLSAAFSTSIIGVGSSFVLSLLVKLRIDWLEKTGYKGKAYIRQHPHELLYNIQVSNHEIRDAIIQLRGEGQPATLEDISTAVKQLTEGAAQKLEDLLNEFSSRLEGKIEASSNEAISNAQKTVVSVNESFTAQTSALLQQNIKHIADFFEEHKELLTQTAHDFSTESTSLKSGIEETKKDLEEKITAVKQAFGDSVESMAGKYREETTSMSKFFEELKSTIAGSSRDMTEKHQEEMASLQGIFKEVRSTLDASMKEMTEKYKAEAASLTGIFADVKSKLVESVEDMSQKHSDEIAKIIEVAEKSKSTLEEINTAVQEATQAVLEANLEKLEKSFRHIESLQLTAHNNLRQTTKEFADAVEHYQALTNNQGELIELIRKQLEKMESHQENTSELLDKWQILSTGVLATRDRVADIATTIAQLDSIHGYLNGHALTQHP